MGAIGDILKRAVSDNIRMEDIPDDIEKYDIKCYIGNNFRGYEGFAGRGKSTFMFSDAIKECVKNKKKVLYITSSDYDFNRLKKLVPSNLSNDDINQLKFNFIIKSLNGEINLHTIRRATIGYSSDIIVVDSQFICDDNRKCHTLSLSSSLFHSGFFQFIGGLGCQVWFPLSRPLIEPSLGYNYGSSVIVYRTNKMRTYNMFKDIVSIWDKYTGNTTFEEYDIKKI